MTHYFTQLLQANPWLKKSTPYACQQSGHLSHFTLNHISVTSHHSYRFKAVRTHVTFDDGHSSLGTALFWVITQRAVVIPYPCFRKTYWSHFQGSRILDPWRFRHSHTTPTSFTDECVL